MEQLLARHGVLTREAVLAEGIVGGFCAVYDVLKAMEEVGRVRRGYFIAGLGATQFTLPGTDEALRACRDVAKNAEVVALAATDPANPYGAALSWPSTGVRPQRIAGATVLIRDGVLVAYLGRHDRSLSTFVSGTEPAMQRIRRDVAQTLGRLVDSGRRRVMLVASIDGGAPEASPLARELVEAGFVAGSKGYLRRVRHE